MPSLYDEIGGRPTIELLVTSFYQRVLGDPDLLPFFEGCSVDQLKRMQAAFFSIALGGPEPDVAIDLYRAHQGLGIEVKHLTRFTEHLVATLEASGIPAERASRIHARIATYSNDVLGDSGVDG